MNSVLVDALCPDEVSLDGPWLRHQGSVTHPACTLGDAGPTAIASPNRPHPAPPKEMLMNSRTARHQSATNLANSPTLWDVGSAVPPNSMDEVLRRVSSFPRLRYMGSKYRLVPHLAELFAELGGSTALDAFSGSGVVSYTLKCLGYEVTSNDFLAFPGVIASAAVANQRTKLSDAEVARIVGPPLDGRDFIQTTFDGLYFTAADREFLDSAWSHIDGLRGAKRSLAISALVLAAARKQPRGVFTFTELRYDDGRRDLRLPLREHFIETVAEYNSVVFDSGAKCRAIQSDVFDVDPSFDLVYLDPPYRQRQGCHQFSLYSASS